MPEESNPSVKRLNLNLPVDRFSRIQRLAQRRGTTIADLVRTALGLVERIEAGASQEEHRIIVAEVDKNHNIVREFVMPI